MSLIPRRVTLIGAIVTLVAFALSPSLLAKDKQKTPTLGSEAPGFSLQDVSGKTVTLADLRGKVVVLEWFNPECPFVKNAHLRGALRTLGNEAMDQGVVWLAINSSAPGRQGAGKATNQKGIDDFGIRYPVLLDPSGKVGRAYGATKTPEMFVINAKGQIVYHGALDNTGSGDPEDAKGGTHEIFVATAMRAAIKDPTSSQIFAQQKPYGCSVKYAK